MTIILATNLHKIRVSKRRTPAKSGSLANKRQARSSSVCASDLSCSDPSEWSKLHSERAMRNLPKLSLQASQVSSKPSKRASKTKQACQQASQANQASQAQVIQVSKLKTARASQVNQAKQIKTSKQ
ncbi:uncharacterized protein METZ01_LOCUS335624, partial [marine metagenome]